MSTESSRTRQNPFPEYAGVAAYKPDFTASALRIGIVVARFNQTVGEGLLAACMDELTLMGIPGERVTLTTVPGALEIPLVLQTMARSGRFDALVALGAVIRGKTYHFELVSNEMGAGITRVGLDEGIPIANGVLTVEDDDQAQARMDEKGRDCARAAVESANILKTLKNE